MKILFLHPDLGIGGAERLVVDAAVALDQLEHDVHFLTAHHDPGHSFKETHDGTLGVTVVGDWLPRSMFGRFFALFAYLRMIVATLYLLFFAPTDGDLGNYDLIIADQVSAPIPLIKWFSHLRNGRRAKVVFYCHFPDMLLTKRESVLKKIYRGPLDWLEEVTTGMADVILVNSKFTGEIFRQTFTRLSNRPLQVLYPTVNFDVFDQQPEDDDDDVDLGLQNISCVFLSINRYERKKNLKLAIEALNQLREELRSRNSKKTFWLIMAGGYDDRVEENREYLEELMAYAAELQIQDHISFLKSPSDATKHALLQACTAVLYTPANEHFGIVPLEAMYMRRPVISCNSGGPLETVNDGQTGFHCEPNADSFAAAMMRFVEDNGLAQRLGNEGHEHVKRNFSYQTFKNQLNNVINGLCETQ